MIVEWILLTCKNIVDITYANSALAATGITNLCIFMNAYVRVLGRHDFAQINTSLRKALNKSINWKIITWIDLSVSVRLLKWCMLTHFFILPNDRNLRKRQRENSFRTDRIRLFLRPLPISNLLEHEIYVQFSILSTNPIRRSISFIRWNTVLLPVQRSYKK